MNAQMTFARAQSRHDNSLPADRHEPDLEPVLDEMVTCPDCFDSWLSMHVLPDSVAGLLSLILDRGLPRNNGSESDDKLNDVYMTRINCVRDDFDTWAQEPARGKVAPIDQWLADMGPY